MMMSAVVFIACARVRLCVCVCVNECNIFRMRVLVCLCDRKSELCVADNSLLCRSRKTSLFPSHQLNFRLISDGEHLLGPFARERLQVQGIGFALAMKSRPPRQYSTNEATN